MIFLLDDDEIWFPDPHDGDPDGEIAHGGDLSVPRLLFAYSHGIFPWFSFRLDPIRWFCPLARFVIFPSEIHISHSMRNLINKGRYEVTFNQDFRGVIEGCGHYQNRIDHPYAWLGEDIMKAYTELHESGYAASVEVWDGEKLVGGLYGVCMGRVFIGESMFSEAPSASKLALIGLALTLGEKGDIIIDCQFETPHLKSMGGRHISYEEYLKYLQPETPPAEEDSPQ